MRLIRNILVAIEVKNSASFQLLRTRLDLSSIMGKRLNSSFQAAENLNATNNSSRTSRNNPALDEGSIDENEMRKFKRLAQNWWIENGEFEALHRMNAIRVPLIRDTMINYRDGLPALDKQKLKSYLGILSFFFYSIIERIQ